MKLSQLFNKFKILFETFFIYYRLYYINTNKIKFKEINLNSKFELKILNIEDLYLFDFYELPNNYLKIYADRLKNSNFICFGVLDISNNRLAYYSWINFEKKTYCKEIKKSLELKNKNACLFEDDNTHLEYRNCKIHSFVMNERLKYCISNNISKAYIVIHPFNIPAIKTISKYKFKKIIHIPISYRDNSIQLFIKKLISFEKFCK